KFGVLSTGLPVNEKSPSPWSSVVTIRTFGFVAGSPALATEAAAAATPNRKSQRIGGETFGLFQGSVRTQTGRAVTRRLSILTRVQARKVPLTRPSRWPPHSARIQRDSLDGPRWRCIIPSGYLAVWYNRMPPAPPSPPSAPPAAPPRGAILARLAGGGASVMELAAPSAMPLPAVTKHLKVLRRAGLITQGRRA